MALHPFFLPKVKSSSITTTTELRLNQRVQGGVSELEEAECVEHKKARHIVSPLNPIIDNNVDKAIPFLSGKSETVQNPTHTEDTQELESGPDTPSSLSILHQLYNRSISSMVRNITIPKSPRWFPCPWLHLQCSSTVTSIEFDQQGVLLAVATTGSCHSIHVWDWDTVLSSDLQGRIDGKKDVIPPILAFNLPHVAIRLKWDQDSLAVSFRGNSQIHIYDMFTICNSSVPPERVCTVLRVPIQNVSRYQGPKSISFLPNQHFVAGFPCGTVCLWHLASPPTISWLWKSVEPVTCLLPMARNLILVGGSHGSFAMLDWTKVTRKAFASEKSPTILSLWKSQIRMQARFPTVPSRDWGIQTMHLDTPCSKNWTETVKDDSCFGRCRLTWVTSGGWCLSLELHRRHGNPQILSSPPEIQQMTFEGKVVSKSNVPRFSSPSDPIVATSDQMGSLVWHSVPRITHILPPHDRRIGIEREVRVDTDIELEYWTNATSSVQRITLSQRPLAIALPRNQEWMLVVVSSTRLGIWNARFPPLRRKRRAGMKGEKIVSETESNVNVPPTQD
jgi:hypothetical protein